MTFTCQISCLEVTEGKLACANQFVDCSKCYLPRQGDLRELNCGQRQVDLCKSTRGMLANASSQGKLTCASYSVALTSETARLKEK